MVIKTEICAFSDFRIYPGHGSRFVRKDGQVLALISKKCKSLYHQRKKPVKLTWTVSWRKLNKKDNKDDSGRKKKRRVQMKQKAFVGTSVDVIRKKRNEKPAEREAAREAAKKEAKARLQKKAAKGTTKVK